MEKSLDKSNEVLDSIQLEALAVSNPYAAVAIDLYRHAIEVYEIGGDIGEYLSTVEWVGNNHYAITKRLNEDEIAFVAEASHEDDDTYNTRFKFVFSQESSAASLLRYKKDSNVGSRYNNWRHEIGVMTGTQRFLYETRDEGRQALETFGDLDRLFNANGQRVNQLEELHRGMTELAMAVDLPDVALSCVQKVHSNESFIELYFAAIKSANQSGNEVLQHIGDLRSKLESDPYLYCHFLIREIEELPHLGPIIDANVRDITVLTNDGEYFGPEAARKAGLSTHDKGLSPSEKERAEYTVKPDKLRYRLARALLFADREDLLPQLGIDSGPSVTVEKVLGIGLALDRNIHYAQTDKLSWTNKRILRAIAKRAIRWHSTWQATIDESNDVSNNAWLSLALAGYDRRIKSGSKRLKPYDFLQKYAGSFASGYRTRPEDKEVFIKNYPELAIQDKERSVFDKLQDAILMRDPSIIDTQLNSLLASNAYTTLQKLHATVAVTGALFEKDEQLHLQAKILTDAETIMNNIDANNKVDLTFIEASSWKQDINQQIESLFTPTHNIRDLKQRLLVQLHVLQVQARHDTSPDSATHYMLAEVKKTYAGATQGMSQLKQRELMEQINRLELPDTIATNDNIHY